MKAQSEGCHAKAARFEATFLPMPSTLQALWTTLQTLMNHVPVSRTALGLRPLIARMQSTTLGTVAIKTNPPK
jgi:hypothetical protein